MADTRVALVTGGSRGIGAEITRQLVGRGRSVVYTYRSGRREAAALAEELGPSACPAHFELGDAASAEALVEAALSRWGRLGRVL